MTKVSDRFLKYIKFDTRSDENSKDVPTTAKQMTFAKELVKEMDQIGLKNITLDDKCYIMAELPSNIDKKVPVIGFISHIDTSPDMTAENVNPQIVRKYNGEDIVLNKENNIILSPKEFPELLKYVGLDLITTDGTTLLGADDKAGVAEIMTAMEYFINNPQIPHGTIKVAFTPDEEVGRGADYFDVEKFGADFAFTIDGGTIGELEYESFNAASAVVNIKGRNVHPGYAFKKMVNSILIATKFIGMLPSDEVPEKTKGYEGFYHLNSVDAEVEHTVLKYIIRDFDRENFEKRKQYFINVVKKLNDEFGEGTVTAEVKDQYYNMGEKIKENIYIVDLAKKAMEKASVTPLIKPIRGGTDGSRLSYMGLPTPNIFAGGENFHGKYEYVPIQSMEKAVEVIVNIGTVL